MLLSDDESEVVALLRLLPRLRLRRWLLRLCLPRLELRPVCCLLRLSPPPPSLPLLRVEVEPRLLRDEDDDDLDDDHDDEDEERLSLE